MEMVCILSLGGTLLAMPGATGLGSELARVQQESFNSIVKYMMSNGISEAAVCTHGGVIATILATYGLPQLPMSEWTCVNGKGFAVKITPSVWMREGMFEVAGLFPLEKSEQEFESEQK